MERWKAHFKDEKHDVNTVIENNFSQDNITHSLRMTIGETVFTGMDFADFEIEGHDEIKLKNNEFKILKWGKSPNYIYELQRYCLSFTIPLKVIDKQSDNDQEASIFISYSKKEDVEKSLKCQTMLDEQRVYPDVVLCHNFSLKIKEDIYYCDKPSLDFETSLIEICKKMSKRYLLKSCFGCKYSDYSPYGNDYFGTMLCFKKQAAKYIRVSSKDDFWEVHNDGVQVQETYCCGDFSPRIDFPGGYRGLIY